jgi:hypothetical protein
MLHAVCATACWRGGPATPPVAAAPRPAPPPALIVPAPPPSLSAEVLLSTIRGSYLAGLQRCYAQHLKRDPRARGTVTLTMTVAANGRLSARHVDGIGPRVESCVERQMARWEFSPATEGEQSFRLSLQLTPL